MRWQDQVGRMKRRWKTARIIAWLAHNLGEHHDYWRIAELGVYKGHTARTWRTYFPHASLVLVDTWRRLKKTGPINHRETEMSWEDMYLGLCKEFIGTDTTILRTYTAEAAELYPDYYFDCVYIDADHRFLGVCNDIMAWWPKVRKGGILAGHDYKRFSHGKGVVRGVHSLIGEANIIHGPNRVWVTYVR